MCGDWNFIQYNIGCGQYIFRQCCGYLGVDVVEIDVDIGGFVVVCGGCYVVYQIFVQLWQVVNYYNGLFDCRVDCDGCCYVIEFDLEFVNFDLFVGMVYEFDVIVSIVVCQIFGLVYVGIGIKWVGNELFCGQFGVVMVFVCDMCFFNIDFVDYIGWYWL